MSKLVFINQVHEQANELRHIFGSNRLSGWGLTEVVNFVARFRCCPSVYWNYSSPHFVSAELVEVSVILHISSPGLLHKFLEIPLWQVEWNRAQPRSLGNRKSLSRRTDFEPTLTHRSPVTLEVVNNFTSTTTCRSSKLLSDEILTEELPKLVPSSLPM